MRAMRIGHRSLSILLTLRASKIQSVRDPDSATAILLRKIAGFAASVFRFSHRLVK